MTTITQGDFPYEEIRLSTGDYFDSAQDAMDITQLTDDHIWSVVEGEDDEQNGIRTGCTVYGPPGHVVNVIGFIATAETHDGDTYYEETYEMGEVEE